MPSVSSSLLAEGDPCENCARPSHDLLTVQRVYLMASDAEGGLDGAAQEILDDFERWCMSCRSQYPHVQVTED